MELINARIGGKMRELVRQWLTAEPLARYAESFIDDKLREPVIFGGLTVLHYYMFEGKGGDELGAAAAVELMILASDMLDDLEDGDAPAKPWMQAPPAHALHVATALLTLAQHALVESAPDRRLGGELAWMMNRQLLQSADGQMLDLMNGIRDEASYLAMVRQKSASLFVLACMAGVMAAGRPWNDKVAEYAAELGMAAQIKNDIKDLLRWDEKSDFLQRKASLPLFYLLESVSDRDAWIAEYYEGRLSDADVRDKETAFREACERTGATLYGSVMGRMHYNRFRELVEALDAVPEWKTKLLEAAR